MKQRTVRLALPALALPSSFRPAAAQIESALLSKISFNLTNPGGKSLAMGGAFTAIADDATAAIANPAGLGLLSSVEVGHLGEAVGRRSGSSPRARRRRGALTAPYARSASSASDQPRGSGVEFAGVVLPVSRRFVAAVSYAENLRFEGDTGEDGYAVHRAARQPVERHDAAGLPLRVPRVRRGRAAEPAPRPLRRLTASRIGSGSARGSR